MKTNSLPSMAPENRWRGAVLLLAFLSLICLSAASAWAQLNTQKRVTALQLGQAAEGARVTIVSDSALNDYEAFRRGDRFYVKIPLADFAAAQPNFRGNGFDDVRVQKVGDSVVVSFKLQPGATARVDQRSNRLDVIFSALGVVRNVPAVTTVNSYPASRNRRNSGDTDASAGPLPPTSTRPSAQSGTNTYPDPLLEDRTNNPGRTTRNQTPTRRTLSESSGGQDRKGNRDAEKLPSQTRQLFPQPTPAPATSASPFSTPTAPAAFATPATPYVQQPAGVPVPVGSRTPEATGWESRVKFLKAWARLNRSALIVGGLIALILLIGLVLWSRLKGRRRANGSASRKAPGKPISEKVVGRPDSESEPLAGTPVAAAPAGFAAADVHQKRGADQDREVFEL